MFVVFEGIDGSGKTTISNRVAEALRAQGLPVTHLRAEGKFVSRVSEAIRELGRDARNLELEPRAEFFLYVARDVQLIEQALRPALARGDIVLADRFLFTAEVLARYGRHLSKSFVSPVLEAAAAGIEPDLVLLVDVDPTLARARRKAFKIEVADERPPSRKGLAGVGLQHRVRQGYLDLASEHPERWVVLDNQDELEVTVKRVTDLVVDVRGRGRQKAITEFRAALPTRPPSRAVDSVEIALEAFLAWVDARLEREPRVAAYLLGGIFGSMVDERRKTLAARVPRALLAALTGLSDDVSWELRERLMGEYPEAVAATLSGVVPGDPRAAELRARLLDRAPREVLASVNRQNTEEAWALREQFADTYLELVVSGLGALDDPRAWQLRERWFESTRPEWGTRPDLARLAARSVTGLEDERAWAVRAEVTPSAPVAAIASLAGLTSPESFRLRSSYVSFAPKVVMATLRGLAVPEAWALRARVADDCKEALDSIQNLDTEEAWELRERYRDRWPSTVVKTLGVLSDGERARSLISRQLGSYPDNISLLKHVAAVALGTHHGGAASE